MLMEQLFDLRQLEVRTENLEHRADLQDQVIDRYSVTQ